LGYHVGMLNNWKTVVRDQLQTIDKCGFGDLLSESIISYHGDQFEELQGELFDAYPSYFNKRNTHFLKAQGSEVTIMDHIHDYCVEKESRKESVVVFYMHDKGVSRYKENWFDQMLSLDIFTYGHSLYWRKAMEYFLIERPELCLNKIIRQGYPACGSRLHKYPSMHYHGNFWAASCSYISTLDRIKLSGLEDYSDPEMLRFHNYVAPEMWIGRGFKNDNMGYTYFERKPHVRSYIQPVMPFEYYAPKQVVPNSPLDSLFSKFPSKEFFYDEPYAH